VTWRGDVRLGVEAWGPGEPPPDDAEAVGPDADAEAVARKILLDQLTGRARSRQELADRLAAKRVPADIAKALLDRFEEVGLIDDEAFARLWIADRQRSKGLASRALSQELRRKGVPDEVVQEALDEVEPGAEEEAARALVRKKLRTLTRVDDATATRRLVGMLARKGYPSGLAFSVVRDEVRAAGRSLDEARPPEAPPE
jgi:regulatory protein